MKTDAIVFVDAHVHIHQCFHLDTFFSFAKRNFSTLAGDKPVLGVLMLTEGVNENGFERLEQFVHPPPEETELENWKVSRCQEREGLVVTDKDHTLLVVAGRQIITEQGLEVLALGTRESFQERRPIRDTLREVALKKAIPVVPWGVGKWIGERGRIVKSIIEDKALPHFFLGDNGNRPTFWPQSRLFKTASDMGITNLPGSDPLAFRDQQKRVGSFGFSLNTTLSKEYPVKHLKEILTGASFEPGYFGKPEKLNRFFPIQLRIQVQKHI